MLGDGELTKKLTVTAHRFSAGAKEKIEKAGGKVVCLRDLLRDPHQLGQRLVAAAEVVVAA